MLQGKLNTPVTVQQSNVLNWKYTRSTSIHWDECQAQSKGQDTSATLPGKVRWQGAEAKPVYLTEHTLHQMALMRMTVLLTPQ